MFYSVIVTLVAFILIYASMSVRVNRIESVRARKRTYEEMPSPLAEAIKDFVAVAGGVYLALMALSEFLKVPAPIQAEVWGISFDPIAVVAIVLAVAAPMFPTKSRI